jgi:hypothetical protein
MIIYLQYIDFNLWLSVQNRFYRPIKIKNDIEISKTISEYTENIKKIAFYGC